MSSFSLICQLCISGSSLFFVFLLVTLNIASICVLQTSLCFRHFERKGNFCSPCLMSEGLKSSICPILEIQLWLLWFGNHEKRLSPTKSVKKKKKTTSGMNCWNRIAYSPTFLFFFSPLNISGWLKSLSLVSRYSTWSLNRKVRYLSSTL